MIDNFQNRLAVAKQHEWNVMRNLHIRCWLAEPFGQGQLSDGMRDLIKGVRSHVRYLPDIIAAETGQRAHGRLVFIDAKAGETFLRTGNHDIESAALDAAKCWAHFAGACCEVYFVFGDGGVISPDGAATQARQGHYRGNGSGTPFVLIPASSCVPFPVVFGDGPLIGFKTTNTQNERLSLLRERLG